MSASTAADECGAPMVVIAGGEPLLHREIDEITRRMIAKKKFVYLCTNALLLEGNWRCSNTSIPKVLRASRRLAFVKRDNCVGLPIHSGLQNQFVAGVAELRAPAKERLYRLRQPYETVNIKARFPMR